MTILTKETRFGEFYCKLTNVSEDDTESLATFNFLAGLKYIANALRLFAKFKELVNTEEFSSAEFELKLGFVCEDLEGDMLSQLPADELEAVNQFRYMIFKGTNDAFDTILYLD